MPPASIQNFGQPPKIRMGSKYTKAPRFPAFTEARGLRLLEQFPKRRAFGGLRAPSFKTLEPQRNPAAQRTTQSADRQRCAVVAFDARGVVEKVARVNGRLRAQGQSERRKLLRDEDAQRRVVDGELTRERVNREDGRARREA